MTTNRPGAIINRLNKLGTLMINAPADVSVLQLIEGPVEFVDTMKMTRQVDKTSKPIQVVRNGIPQRKPFASPFAWVIEIVSPLSAGGLSWLAFERFELWNSDTSWPT